MKLAYHRIAVDRSGKVIHRERVEVGAAPAVIGGELVTNRTEALELVNRWNSWAVLTPAVKPTYVYWLEGETP